MTVYIVHASLFPISLGVSYDELTRFIPAFLSTSKLEVFAHGNISEEVSQPVYGPLNSFVTLHIRTVETVLKTTCIQRLPVYSDHCRLLHQTPQWYTNGLLYKDHLSTKTTITWSLSGPYRQVLLYVQCTMLNLAPSNFTTVQVLLAWRDHCKLTYVSATLV